MGLRTVFSDDDGDGVYDDVHVVNVMDEGNQLPSPHYHNKQNSNSSSSSSSYSRPVLSSKTKRKIFVIVCLVLFGLSVLTKIAIAILAMFL